MATVEREIELREAATLMNSYYLNDNENNYHSHAISQQLFLKKFFPIHINFIFLRYHTVNMRKFLPAIILSCAVAGVVTFAAPPAIANSVNEMIARKRAEAEQNRLQRMQEIQHRQSNPEAFMRREAAMSSGPASISFDAASNGHYYVPVHINGRSITFIADTGATDIFLTQNDAKVAGINLYNLNYNLTYNTANGQVKAAETMVSELSVGPIRFSNMKVSVSQNQGGVSLLGMSFFRQLSSYNVQNDKLTMVK